MIITLPLYRSRIVRIAAMFRNVLIVVADGRC